MNNIVIRPSERERRKAEISRKWSREYQTHIGQHANEPFTPEQERLCDLWKAYMARLGIGQKET